MLKPSKVVKEPGLSRDAADRLSSLLGQVPGLRVGKARAGKPADTLGVDFALTAAVAGGERFELLVECKSSGQPRHARPAILKLRESARKVGKLAAPVFVAPILSGQVRDLCRESNVSFLDLEGNARLAFGSVFIERLVTSRLPSAPRPLKSLYKPRAAQILRVLLRDPARVWKTVDLAEAAQVSLGHVSNVRTQLLDREWAAATPSGLQLTAPDALLDDWRDSYDARAVDRFPFYTVLHGEALETAAVAALSAANRNGGRAAFCSLSAADRLAPYARVLKHYFVADDAGLIELQASLQLESSARGDNVIVTRPREAGVFLDVVEPVRGVPCTSPVQTYLDLSAMGDRSREAAEHLRRRKLAW